MSIPNTTSRRVWAYEPTPRTSAIIDANSVTYDFGEYDDSIKQWKMGAMQNKISPYFNYNKRTPLITPGGRMFDTFHEIFNPTTAQWLLWILGKCTDASPDTIEPLDTGYQYPLTVRHEEGGGSNETFEQMVSSWCIDAYFRAAALDPFVVDLEFAYEQYEDHDDEPQLTTPPRRAGHTGVSLAYNGMPTITYDPDSAATVIPQIIKAEGKISQNYSTTVNGSASQQTVYKETYEPVNLTLQGVHVVNDYWDKFMDKDQQDWEVAVYKPNTDYYIKMKAVNAVPVRWVKEGQVLEGWYLSTLVLKAEEITAKFAWDGSDTWANHFKGEVV